MSSTAAPAVTAIKPGDVVKLKTGGPRMTADQVGEATITCVYFDTFNKLVTVELAPSSLVREETAS